MEWLSTAPYWEPQISCQEKRVRDTGECLFELPQYKQWRSTPGSLLWLPGISGCGKSVLCSTVVGDIKEDCKLNPSKFLAYWYFQFDVDAMIRSLIKQLSRSPLTPSVSNLRKEHQYQGSQPGSKALRNILEDVLSKIPGEVYLVFDALDECPQNAQTKERRSLLSLLTGLLERYNDKVYILATSRPERDIEQSLGKFPKIDLETRLADDVRKFVTTSIEEGDFSEWEPKVQKSIIDTLLSLKERRFRWAELQMMELEECNNSEEIHHALRIIPHSLEQTYRKFLNRIKPKDIPIARGILALICLSPVALDLDTVAAMLNITVSAILKICTTSLVNVFEGKVQFAHFSVQEFLVISDEELSPAHHPCQFTISSAQIYLVEKTADCLLEQTEELSQVEALKRPAFLYSAKHWSTHLTACGDISQSHPDIQLKIHRLFTISTVYFNWVRATTRENVNFGAIHGFNRPKSFHHQFTRPLA
ncbi:hypothetical protein N7540_006006 [Penicillium herquei]|nr:hypothetical protein N7540_006006 [Penicillium herquei]